MFHPFPQPTEALIEGLVPAPSRLEPLRTAAHAACARHRLLRARAPERTAAAIAAILGAPEEHRHHAAP